MLPFLWAISYFQKYYIEPPKVAKLAKVIQSGHPAHQVLNNCIKTADKTQHKRASKVAHVNAP
jgi:hypothetical protein